MTEFTKRGLQVKYEKEIEAWFVYLDQQKFGKELEKKMLIEIERFMADRKTVEELLKEIFKEPEWVIEVEEGLLSQNPMPKILTRALGYA